MLIGFLPYSLSQSYSSTLRETGQATLPMYAGVSAVLVNLVLNYVLIFGHFGFPALGVDGAAIATVISRFAELFIMAFWVHRNPEKNPFFIGAYKSLKVPKALVFDIFKKGLPLMVNEALWAAGIAVLNQAYSLKGYDVVSASNISQTFYNVFATAFMAVGVAIGIIIGQMLGSNEKEEAYDAARKLIAFSMFVSVIIGVVYFVAANWIPLIYNTTDSVHSLATVLMQITAVAMPLHASAHASYFTLRSGGQTFVTFLFDSCFVWVINVPVVLLLCHLTPITIIPLFAVSEGMNLIKSLIGFAFIKSKSWIRNIVR
jgi:putative MATE family efflux protein